MKVKDVIKSMQDYDLEDEVVILWWSKDIIDEDNEVTNEVWSKVVKTLDDESNLDFANTVISDEIYGALRDNGVDA
jgi:hypothetical protein